MITRLDAVKAGWVFNGYIFGLVTKGSPEYNLVEKEIEKVFINPGYPLNLVKEKYRASKGSNEILSIAFHGLPDYVLIWFRIGQIVVVTTTESIHMDEDSFMMGIDAIHANLARAGLDETKISKVIRLIEQFRTKTIDNGMTTETIHILSMIDSLIQNYASQADFEANRPKIDMEIVMGDKFENISHSTIVNRSIVIKAFNKLKNDFGEETANAFIRIAEEIQKSGNKDAAENFNSFSEELQKQEPKKPILRSLWNGVTAALPSILQMTEVVAKIVALF